MRELAEYQLEQPTWCKGCGLYGLFTAFKRAVSSLAIEPERLVIVTGIGCHGRFNSYFKSYGFHGLHGRVLPVATGIKLSNPELKVVGVSGDGDAYSIGISHLIHSSRRNIDITYIVANNHIYALTQGQTSPTSLRGFISISTPYGCQENPLNGPLLAFASGATFVARGFSGNVRGLSELIRKGLKHRGFALVEVLSPCVTQNKINTYDWLRENIFVLEEENQHDSRDRTKAWKAMTREEKIAVGLIYEEEKPSFEELVLPRSRTSLAFQDLHPETQKLKKIMEKFK